MAGGERKVRKEPSEEVVVLRPNLRRSSRGGGRKAVDRAPRVKHGTLVSFHVDCARCGAHDVLPFVPRTQGEYLCQGCAREVFGDDWAHGRPVDEGMRHLFHCASCGEEDFVPFRPSAEMVLTCRRCRRGEERAWPERIGGAVLDARGGVRKKPREG